MEYLLHYFCCKIKNVLVKFDDKKENENVIQLDFIEVVDPKGDEYKLVVLF